MTKGERIKRLRIEKRITQEEMAKALNTTKQTISKYEKGIVTNIPSDRIEAMSKLLETTPEYILGWEKIQKNNDTAADIVDKLLDNPSIYPLMNRLLDDSEFLSLVKSLSDLDSKKIKGVSQMLNSFL